MQVPFLDLQVQYRRYKEDFDQAIRDVSETSAYVGGPSIAAFERQFGQYLDVAHVCGVANGTDALYLALRASGIGAGDEVITAANTFIATTEAITTIGASVVIVDCHPKSYTIDPAGIEAAITEKTRAIIPVHLFGQPADMEPIMDLARRHGLMVIEDAAQAHGAYYRGKRVGTIGDVGCFSCYPGKNLGAFGDAGVVVTKDAELADRIRLLANHGSRAKYVHQISGWNSRLDSIQAAVLSVKLRHLDEWNNARNRNAELYREALRGTPVILPDIINDTHVWHLYVVQVKDREALIAHLAGEGIGTGIHYPQPIHLLPAYDHLPYSRGDFPVAECLAPRVLSLPMFPELGAEQIAHIGQAICRFYADSDGTGA